MKSNPGKYYLVSSNTEKVVSLRKVPITSSLSEKLFRITLNSELKFEEHVSNICNIVNKNFNALGSIANHMSLCKRELALTSFVESQFSFSLLIWMYH